MDKREYIKRLAVFLDENGTTMSVPELAEHLNRNQFKTGYGTEYKGERGTYTLVEATYKWLAEQELPKEAECVAKAFPQPNGTYAYNKV